MKSSYLSTLNAHIGQTKGGTSAKTNSAVPPAVHGCGHDNLDVLQLCNLGYSPIESRKLIAFFKVSNVLLIHVVDFLVCWHCSPPEMAVVSRITFFKPTAKESSPEIPVVGSWPISQC